MALSGTEEWLARADEFATPEDAVATAQQAFDNGQEEEAFALWTQIRELFPDEQVSYLAPARALIGLDRADEADALLTEGQNRLPDAPALMVERARLLRDRGDVASAAAMFAAVRIAAPEAIEGYFEGAACLRRLGRSAVAEGVLSEGLSRFPDVAALAIDFAVLAEDQTNWTAARTRWRSVCDRFPAEPSGYLGLAGTLAALDLPGEAEAVLAEGVAALPDDVDLAVAHAWAAEHRDPGETLYRLEQAATRFPDDPSPQFGWGAVLRDLDRLDEADAVLGAAARRFVGHTDVLANYARVAERRGDRREALRRWARLVEDNPAAVEGYLGYAAALATEERFDDADTVLAEADRRFPLHPDVLDDTARLAYGRGDWQRALDCWMMLREHHPERMNAFAEVGVALRELDRFDDAEAVLAAAAAESPEDAEIAIQYAWIASYRNDLELALSRWDDVLARFPDDPSPWFAKGAVLGELGRFEEAEEVFAEAAERFPEHQDVLVNRARLAQMRDDWAEALLRWEVVYSLFPDLTEAVEGRSLALSQLDREAVGAAVDEPLADQTSPAEREMFGEIPDAWERAPSDLTEPVAPDEEATSPEPEGEPAMSPPEERGGAANPSVPSRRSLGRIVRRVLSR